MKYLPYFPPINIIQFYEPSDIEKYGSLIATVLLVFVTFLYWWSNRKMANVMKKDFELKVSPYVDVAYNKFKRSNNEIVLYFGIFNRGESRVRLMSAKSIYINQLNKQKTSLKTLFKLTIPPHTPPDKLWSAIITHSYNEISPDWDLGNPRKDMSLKVSVLFEFESVMGKPYEVLVKDLSLVYNSGIPSKSMEEA